MGCSPHRQPANTSDDQALQKSFGIEEMNQPVWLGKQPDDSIEGRAGTAPGGSFNRRRVKADDIKKVIDQQAVPFAAKVDHQIDTGLLSLSGFKPEPEPHVDYRHNPSPEIEQPGNGRRRQRDSVDGGCPKHLGDIRRIDGKAAVSDEKTAPAEAGASG